MRWLPSVLLTFCTACSAAHPTSALDRSTHVERVIEDVTAMVEGMAAAHSADRVVLRGPDFRSSSPATVN